MYFTSSHFHHNKAYLQYNNHDPVDDNFQTLEEIVYQNSKKKFNSSNQHAYKLTVIFEIEDKTVVLY